MATSVAATRGSRRRGAIRAAAAAAAVVVAMAGGCASQESDTVTRTGTRELGSDGNDGYVGGNALTQVPPEERQAAPVASGESLDGKGTVSTGDYPGKVVVINVWGSWCAPCRAEAPDLNEASEETADIAAFVGINIRDSEPAAARAFVRAFKVPYPSIFDPDGVQLLKFAGTLPPNGIPTTLVIDKQGRIAARVVGIVSKTTLVQLIEDAEQGR